MNTLEKDIIELASRAINRKYADDGFFDNTNWEELYKLALKSGLCAVVYDVVKRQKSVPETIKKEWEIYAFKIFMRQSAHFNKMIGVTEAIAKAGYNYAVFKGPIVANAYPNFLYRSSSDTDILVDDKDSKEVGTIIESLGYDYEECFSKEKVLHFSDKKTGHVIELHTSVFEDYEGAKIDILKELNFGSSNNRVTVNVKGKSIQTISWNEHFVYLMFHMIKHFMLEGAKIKFFADITLFYNRYIESIDPEFFWEWMNKCNYTTFCENFFTICIERFGMDASIMKGRTAEASKDTLERLLIDFIYVGDKEEQKNHSWQLVNSISPYFTGEAISKESSRFGRVMRFAFPSADLLGERYSYAKKYRILLPIAWIHRAFFRLFIFKKNNQDYYSGMQKINAVDSKLGLLGSVGLLDKD